MYPQTEKGYSSGAALNASIPQQEGVSSVLPRVYNRSIELAQMIRSFRQCIMPTPEKEPSGVQTGRSGLLGQLQEIDDTMAQSVRDMEWLHHHFNS